MNRVESYKPYDSTNTIHLRNELAIRFKENDSFRDFFIIRFGEHDSFRNSRGGQNGNPCLSIARMKRGIDQGDRRVLHIIRTKVIVCTLKACTASPSRIVNHWTLVPPKIATDREVFLFLIFNEGVRVGFPVVAFNDLPSEPLKLSISESEFESLLAAMCVFPRKSFSVECSNEEWNRSRWSPRSSYYSNGGYRIVL